MRPEDWLREAEATLAGGTTEASWRSATHNAYYAVYHHMLEHSKLGAFKGKKDGEVHRDLIAHCKVHADPIVKQIGVRHLPRLRALRNHADYEPTRPFTRELAEEAYEEASEIISMLQ